MKRFHRYTPRNIDYLAEFTPARENPISILYLGKRDTVEDTRRFLRRAVEIGACAKPDNRKNYFYHSVSAAPAKEPETERKFRLPKLPSPDVPCGLFMVPDLDAARGISEKKRVVVFAMGDRTSLKVYINGRQVFGIRDEPIGLPKIDVGAEGVLKLEGIEIVPLCEVE